MTSQPPAAGAERAHELQQRLAAVEDRIQQACTRAGRTRDEVTLVVVTKFFPASDVHHLVRAGVGDIGENKVQEAVRKLEEYDEADRPRPRVHLVGQLQTNKARQAAAVADVVHSVDRDRLVAALARAAEQQERDLDVLLQVDLDPAAEGREDTSRQVPGARGGVRPDGIPALADLVAATPQLRLRGLMAVAPLGADPAEAFGRLRVLSERLREDHPGADVLSAGMSGDLEQAVVNGATHLRVGSAILGARPAPR